MQILFGYNLLLSILISPGVPYSLITFFWRFSQKIFWIHAWPFNSIKWNMKQIIVFYVNIRWTYQDLQKFNKTNTHLYFKKHGIAHQKHQTCLWFYQETQCLSFKQRRELLNRTDTSVLNNIFFLCFVIYFLFLFHLLLYCIFSLDCWIWLLCVITAFHFK